MSEKCPANNDADDADNSSKVQSLGQLTEEEAKELSEIFEQYNLSTISEFFIESGIKITTIINNKWRDTILDQLNIKLAPWLNKIMRANFNRMVDELSKIPKYNTLYALSTYYTPINTNNDDGNDIIESKIAPGNPFTSQTSETNHVVHIPEIISNDSKTNEPAINPVSSNAVAMQDVINKKHIFDFIDGKVACKDFKGVAYFIRPAQLFIAFAQVGETKHLFCGNCVYKVFPSTKGISSHFKFCPNFKPFMRELTHLKHRYINGNKWPINEHLVNRKVKPLLGM